MRVNRPKSSIAPTWPDRLVLVILLGMLVLGLLQFLVAEGWWVTTLVTYLPQIPLLAPLVLALLVAWPWASRSGRRGIVLGLLVIVFGFIHPQVPRPRRVPEGQRVRVVAYNMLHARRGIERVVDLLQRTQPDVVCLEETDPIGPGRPMSDLLALLPGWHGVEADDVAILSPHPLTSDGRVGDGSMLRAVVDLGRPLTVYAVHLDNGLGPGHLRRGLRSMPGSMTVAARKRRAQVTKLLDDTGPQTGPVIVCGDFNTPPRGKLWARMAARFRDAFATAGWGMGYSFRADIPLVRIDYVWCGDGVAVQSCETLRHAGADHRPVLADLVLADH